MKCFYQKLFEIEFHFVPFISFGQWTFLSQDRNEKSITFDATNLTLTQFLRGLILETNFGATWWGAYGAERSKLYLELVWRFQSWGVIIYN